MAFPKQEPLFACRAPRRTVAAHSRGRHHPVTGDHNGNGVGPYPLAHGPGTGAEIPSHGTVGLRPSRGNRQQSVPHPFLKRATLRIQGKIRDPKPSLKVIFQPKKNRPLPVWFCRARVGYRFLPQKSGQCPVLRKKGEKTGRADGERGIGHEHAPGYHTQYRMRVLFFRSVNRPLQATR